jgi:hypothetical protein
MGGIHTRLVPFGKLIDFHGNASPGTDPEPPINMDTAFWLGIEHEDDEAEAVEAKMPSNEKRVLIMATGDGEALP